MSILKVDTINEKTSGNGVEIAHALKGSGIAGHVIQAVTATFSGSSSSTASLVAMATCGSITTTVANSKLLVTAAAQLQVGSSTSADTKAQYALRSSVDSYASNLHTQAVVNYRDSSNGWQQAAMPFHTLHSPSASAGTTITYKIYGNRVSSPQGIYVIDAWGLGAEGKLTILEIAP